jgi:hypothetical protein
LQTSKRSTATEFSDIRSFSRLMLCRALERFMAAMDDSAIATFIDSFSASNLKGLDFFLLLSFFFLSFAELEKKDPEPDDDLAWLDDWMVGAGCAYETGDREDEA